MNRYSNTILGSFLSLIFIGTSYAAIPRHDECNENKLSKIQKRHIKLFVNEAVLYVEKHGLKKASQDFIKPENHYMHDRMYIFMIDDQQYSLSNGGKPELMGKDLKQIPETQESALKIYQTAKKHGGWVNYLWVNPKTNQKQCKTSWVTPFIQDETTKKLYTIGSGLQY
jgi:signal transduction histidine kinase